VPGAPRQRSVGADERVRRAREDSSRRPVERSLVSWAASTREPGRRAESCGAEGAGCTVDFSDRSVPQGAPGKIRTSDNRFRRPVLYPAELRALPKGAVS
jgi:hypothetical protein